MVGFDWLQIESVLDKIAKEIQVAKEATNSEELTDELGDLFFALVNLVRFKKVDAESALLAEMMRILSPRQVQTTTRILPNASMSTVTNRCSFK